MTNHDEAATLSAAVVDADEVVVVAGSAFDPKDRSANDILGHASGRRAVEDLLHALSPGAGERMDWMTQGGLTLAFLRGRSLLVAVQCLLPDYVRCPELWEGDLPLLNAESLQGWFTEHHIRGAT